MAARAVILTEWTVRQDDKFKGFPGYTSESRLAWETERDKLKKKKKKIKGLGLGM